MPISFGCFVCGRRLKARDEHAGRKTRCPGCATVLEVPATLDELIPLEDADDDPTYGLAEAAPPPDPEASFMSWTKPSAAPLPKREPESERHDPFAESTGNSPLREYSYALLALALIPLVISFMGGEEPKVLEQIQKTVDTATPEQRAKILPILSKPDTELKELLAVMPEGKLVGAHLAHDSITHWVYGLISASLFLGFLVLMFERERVPIGKLLGISLFTGTVGVLLLLGFQFCAGLRLNRIPRGWIGLIFLIVRFFGWSYECSEDPNSDFWTSAFGFTCGVGFCEEVCKALPLIAIYHARTNLGWRGACLMGLASGVGFGVSEGIIYSQGMYNGVVGLDTYILRFISCVGLHAMWAGSVGIAIHSRRSEIELAEGLFGFGWVAIKVVAMPMILHGLYDTLLKKDMNLYALIVSLATFAWFAYLIEASRRLEDQPASGRYRAA